MKKVFISILVFVLVIALTPALIYAAPKGPAEKATGGVTLDRPNDDNYRHATFNAQEAKGDNPAKGVFTWIQINTDGTFIQHKVAIDDVRTKIIGLDEDIFIPELSLLV
ncbi:unnamed protein product [marine sediment metagenome]|uniref:Uncharacterized protein n=1 Tax=marine sediment metagenome TaxID=412755 RepID=X1L5T6_9ZZZZ